MILSHSLSNQLNFHIESNAKSWSGTSLESCIQISSNIKGRIDKGLWLWLLKYRYIIGTYILMACWMNICKISILFTLVKVVLRLPKNSIDGWDWINILSPEPTFCQLYQSLPQVWFSGSPNATLLDSNRCNQSHFPPINYCSLRCIMTSLLNSLLAH